MKVSHLGTLLFLADLLFVSHDSLRAEQPTSLPRTGRDSVADAYAQFTSGGSISGSLLDLPFLQTVLMGNQKRPYGLDHLNSSRYNVFIERPYVVEAFNQDARRLGIASYGVSESERWNWRYGVYNMRLIQDEGNYTNKNLQLEFAGRLATTWWYDECSGGRGYGHLGLSGTTAHPDGNTFTDNGST